MIPATVFVPLLLLAAVVRWLVARLFQSHPGPLLARLTPFPFFYHSYRLELPTWIHSLHQRYGDVVEISPGYISLASPDHLAPIYNNLDKEAFYEQFTNYGAPNMFNTRGKKDHLRRRRMLGLPFSRRSVHTDEGAALMCEKAKSLAGYLEAGARGDGCVDVMAAFSYLAMDVITGFTLGEEGGTSCFSDSFHRHFCEQSIVSDSVCLSFSGGLTSDGQRRRPFLNQLSPRATAKLTRVGLRNLHTPPPTRASNALVEEYTVKLVSRASAHLSKDEDGADSRVTPLAAVTRAGLPADEVCAEILDHIGAGMDTTSTTLTFLFYRLASHASVQASLRKALPRRSSFESELDYLTALEATPLLTAVVKETLRLHAAIPGPEPRIVPPEGMVLPGAKLGIFRGGTVVAAQAWTLHRNAAIFGADAAGWKPARWLDEDEEGPRRLDRGMMPFGRGARACIGKDLAIAEMRVATAKLIGAFEFALPEVEGKGTSGMERGESGNYTRAPNAPEIRLLVKRIVDA